MQVGPEHGNLTATIFLSSNASILGQLSWEQMHLIYQRSYCILQQACRLLFPARHMHSLCMTHVLHVTQHVHLWQAVERLTNAFS